MTHANSVGAAKGFGGGSGNAGQGASVRQDQAIRLIEQYCEGDVPATTPRFIEALDVMEASTSAPLAHPNLFTAAGVDGSGTFADLAAAINAALAE